MATTLTPPRQREGNPRGINPTTGPTSCPANIRETKIAFGMQPQSALATANLAVELWSLTKTNPALGVVNPVTEDDAQDIGKGDEFPTTVYPSNLDTAAVIEKYVSSEFMSWLFCFTTGKATKTIVGGTGYSYAATPSDPVVECINLPPFTYAEQIRPQPDSVVDRALVGMVVNDWTLSLASGPGRANCRVSVNTVGTGSVIFPSGLTLPAVTAEHMLNASGAAININNIDYVLNASFISAEFRWNNNVRLASGYYPGSGQQNGYALRGRMEYGDRECTLTFVARAAKGSQEFANLMAQTEGPATITVKGALIGAGPQTHQFSILANRTVTSGVVNGEADGIVTVNCTVRILKPTTGPYITFTAVCETDALFGL